MVLGSQAAPYSSSALASLPLCLSSYTKTLPLISNAEQLCSFTFWVEEHYQLVEMTTFDSFLTLSHAGVDMLSK